VNETRRAIGRFIQTVYLFLRPAEKTFLMGFAEKFVRQCRKPQGFFGRFLGRAMNVGHAKVRRWGLCYVSSESFFAVLDIGCGGGGALRDTKTSRFMKLLKKIGLPL